MKKVFLVLFASAAFSIVACKSGMKNDKMEDSMELKNDVNDAMNSMNDSVNMKMDTPAAKIDSPKM